MMQRGRFRGFARLSAMAYMLVSVGLLGGCTTMPPSDDPGGGDPPPANPVRIAVDLVGDGTVDQEADGSLVTLTARAADGWDFVGWSGSDVPDENPLTVNADEVPAITASFVQPGAGPGNSDSDGDGVADETDMCPDTSAGAEVDTDGCAADQLDSDGDGVTDDIDQCASTPSDVEIDDVGCPVSEGGPDTDDDGVPDDIDQCPETPADADVDPSGCTAGQLDADDDGVTDDLDACADTPGDAEVDEVGCADSQLDTDRDGVTDDLDQCPDTPLRTDVDANGCPANGPPPPPPPPPSTCGNGTVDAGEECDDGNVDPGDGCDQNCRIEVTGPPNDNCANPTAVGDGVTQISNDGATTDGPDEPAVCNFFDYTQLDSDIWFCYDATCDGEAVVSLCGSEYDTKMAVYAGCDCPDSAAIACSDDDCGAGFESRVTFQAQTGQSYLIRIGGFRGDQGNGTLNIRCGVDVCGPGNGDCGSANGSRGCDDAECCNTTCAVDPFCCDVEWDEFCVNESIGLCSGSFASCAPGTGSCAAGNGSPGCDEAACCNAVCMDDPFCCVDTWDDVCAEAALGTGCFLACGVQSGGCFTSNGSPGCESEACCETVCNQDSFCCLTEWDQSCADMAATDCR